MNASFADDLRQKALEQEVSSTREALTDQADSNREDITDRINHNDGVLWQQADNNHQEQKELLLRLLSSQEQNGGFPQGTPKRPVDHPWSNAAEVSDVLSIKKL
jgi:hypothetical protein